jgi:cytochrome c oxidase assembly factor CtaG
LSADILNTVLSAALVFAGKVLYPSYAEAERVTRMTAMQDQAAAGAGMWVVNSVVFLVPAVVMTAQLLEPKRRSVVRDQGSVIPGPQQQGPGAPASGAVIRK